MRAGPLSETRVIELLNRYFVPVYISNEDYSEHGGTASAEEKAERQRIFNVGRQSGLSVGSVHAYVLDSTGRTVDSLHVGTAAKSEPLIAMLQRNVEALNAPAGEPVVPPMIQSKPPSVERNGLLLHLSARAISGAWGGIPGENWTSFNSAEAKGLLPGGRIAAGRQWEIPPALAGRMLVHFYPPTENNDVTKNVIEHQSLRGTVLSVENGIARARLDGDLRMRHSFYHREDGRMVEASLIGYLDFELRSRRIRTLRLVTDQATYNRGTFGIALQAVVKE